MKNCNPLYKFLCTQSLLPPEIASLGVFIICFIAFYGIFLNFVYNNEEKLKKDPLAEPIFSVFDRVFTFWPITHFTLYAVFGFLRPSIFFKLLFFGLLWELFEMLICQLFKTSDGKNKNNKEINKYEIYWWNGTFTDLIFNSAGFFFGVAVRYIFYNFLYDKDESFF